MKETSTPKRVKQELENRYCVCSRCGTAHIVSIDKRTLSGSFNVECPTCHVPTPHILN